MALDSNTTLPPPARAPQTQANVPRIRSTTRPRAMAIFTELPHSHSQHLSDSRATVCRGYADEPERGARPWAAASTSAALPRRRRRRAALTLVAGWITTKGGRHPRGGVPRVEDNRGGHRPSSALLSR